MVQVASQVCAIVSALQAAGEGNGNPLQCSYPLRVWAPSMLQSRTQGVSEAVLGTTANRRWESSDLRKKEQKYPGVPSRMEEVERLRPGLQDFILEQPLTCSLLCVLKSIQTIVFFTILGEMTALKWRQCVREKRKGT